jgi:cell envelope opacity-associated protein A
MEASSGKVFSMEDDSQLIAIKKETQGNVQALYLDRGNG